MGGGLSYTFRESRLCTLYSVVNSSSDLSNEGCMHVLLQEVRTSAKLGVSRWSIGKGNYFFNITLPELDGPLQEM
jgi:hypothetical protein